MGKRMRELAQIRQELDEIDREMVKLFERRMTIAKPRLWSPQDPNLYDVSFTVRVDGKKVSKKKLAKAA